MILESMRKRLHQGLDGIKTVFAGNFIFIWMQFLATGEMY
jgi:hypothetical protein